MNDLMREKLGAIARSNLSAKSEPPVNILKLPEDKTYELTVTKLPRGVHDDVMFTIRVCGQDEVRPCRISAKGFLHGLSNRRDRDNIVVGSKLIARWRKDHLGRMRPEYRLKP